ncbi:MAG TPA: hypothetical protein DCR40_03130 [Prolixibacteraceae bacterium]|nr:hypothetical protein [Prolixibacteraceae bacterium]
MKKIIFLFALFSFICKVYAQDIPISFQPKESGTIIDSILVTNQRTNQKVKLLGNETLTLTKVTGVNLLPVHNENRLLFPNPCNGNAELSFATSSNQQVEVRMYNIYGQLLNTESQFLTSGEHRFNITFPAVGIYHVSTQKEDGSLSFKAICLQINGSDIDIQYIGTEINFSVKNATVGKTMSYAQGDILNCSAFSGKNNTIIADSPTATKVYSVEFYECKDSENNNYPIVKVGTQWWMAKNLQSTKYNNGTSIPHVTDTTVWEHLKTPGYCWHDNNQATYGNTYGALYNWYTVNTGKLCPVGWHVPSDAEWTTLKKYLINNGYGYGGSGDDIAKSMAATTNWYSTTFTGCPGNEPASNNSTGFSGLPGGIREYNGDFYITGDAGFWWSSTEVPSFSAWYFVLGRAESHFLGGEEDYCYAYKEFGFSVRCVRD